MSHLRYPGGKTKAIGILRKFIPSKTHTVLAPFIGGGSFETSLLSGIYVYGYDIFPPLVKYWQCLISNPVQLANEIQQYMPMTKEKFLTLRNQVKLGNDQDYQLAAKYFVLNRCSFSGTTMSGGYSSAAATGRFTQSSVDRVRETQLRNISVEQMNFAQSLLLHPDALVFADPPYVGASGLYGIDGEGQNIDHELLGTLIKQRPRFILTYDDHPTIRKIYEDYPIFEVSWAYGMNASKKSNEIVIISHQTLIDLWFDGVIEFGTLNFV